MMARIVTVALAGLAGLAAWLSLGVLAVVDTGSRARVGVWPPWWALVLLLGLAIGVVAVRRPSPARVVPLGLTALLCLPWLPGRIPPAFLVWYGPLARLLWALVGLGLVAPVIGRARLWNWCASPPRATWAAALVPALAFGAGALALQDRMPAGDEPHYLVITQSLLLDGDLRIENNHARHDYAAYFPGELRPDFLHRGLDRQIYSVHAPGLSAALLPAFAVGGYPGAVLAMIAVSTLGLALLWQTAWRLTGSAGGAWLSWAATAFGAPGFFHGFAIYPDGVGAACTTAGLWALVRMEVGPAALATRHLAWAGAALAALPWLHTRFAIVAGVLGLAIALRLRPHPDRWQAIAAFMAVPALSAAAWFTYFWAIWGTPNPSAPYGFVTETSLANLRHGVPGLLLDQQFGLLPNAPIYVMAVVGSVALVRQRPRLAAELAALVVLYGLAVASYPMWWGGYSAPARFLVAVLPVAAFPVAMAWSRGSAGLRAIALVLLVVSVAITLARTTTDHGGLLFNARDGVDLLLDWASRSVNLPLAWPSAHRGDIREVLRVSTVWGCAGAALGILALWLARRWPARAWVIASTWLGLTVMVSTSLAWGDRAGRLTENTSALDLLQHWPERWGGVGWQSHPYGLLPLEQVPPQLRLASTVRGSRSPDAALLLAMPLVPAGEYEMAVEAEQGARLSGTLSVSVGRTSQVIDTIDLDGHEVGLTGLLIDLPVRVHSLAIRGDDAARAVVGRLSLRPRSVFEPGRRPGGLARRASRYGNARVFFLDDNAFMEKPGFWTRGASVTRLIIDTPQREYDRALSLTLRAGAVPTTATVGVGSWSEQVALAEHGEAALTLPPRGLAPNWQVSIETGMGFRPADHEPGSRDGRNLGIWVEVR